MPAQDFEKLGVFYLGRPYDLAKKKPKKGWLLYESKDLVTHAVCVGMTGSGKTGLCLGLLEEAAIDGIPAIVIDPKGDLANLLLTFPNLAPEDFAPWINEDDARKKGLNTAEYARQQAELWQKGLADWGQDGARIARMREAADFAIYTPGSNAGIPLSIVKSFAAPAPAVRGEPELLRERVSVTVTSLLGLLGVEADPIQSREHILLSTLLDGAWKGGKDLDLGSLIHLIQAPPIAKIGVLGLDSFFPSKDRFGLAMKLNNLLAAPGFSAWMEGAPLEIDQLLYTPEGKPRIAIVSIAHLSDSERMFVVSLLLSQTLGWMRAQPGTTSLRAILYMDEIFGYFPPVANPPSKQPLLTLLKQARAFGLGVVLATQNPVDLDYKGLANTGTWFIGRLQTERDKARVLEGLEGAAAGTGNKFDRQRMEQLLAGLGNRVFLLNNVHEDEPTVFETRWTLSYLRGPLTRAQIKTLMEDKKSAGLAGEVSGQALDGASASPHVTPLAASRPVLPPGVPQYFLPVRSRPPQEATLIYEPRLVGAATIRFSDTKHKVDVSREVVYLVQVTEQPVPVNWEEASETTVALADLEPSPQEPCRFGALPNPAGKAKSYEGWAKDFGTWLYQTQAVDIRRSPALKQSSWPDESERDFRIRLQQMAHERRDEEATRLKQKYAPKIAALQERRRKAEQTVAREEEQANQSKVQTAISIGATLLQAFLGRKTVSASTIGKATAAIRGAGRAIKDSKDVGLAKDNVAAIDQQIADVEAQFAAEVEALGDSLDPLNEPLETVTVKPAKSTIAVKLVALGWTPYWQDSSGTQRQAWG